VRDLRSAASRLRAQCFVAQKKETAKGKAAVAYFRGKREATTASVAKRDTEVYSSLMAMSKEMQKSATTRITALAKKDTSAINAEIQKIKDIGEKTASIAKTLKAAQKNIEDQFEKKEGQVSNAKEAIEQAEGFLMRIRKRMTKHTKRLKFASSAVSSIQSDIHKAKATMKAAHKKEFDEREKLNGLLDNAKATERAEVKAFDSFENAKRDRTRTETQMAFDELKLSIAKTNKPDSTDTPLQSEFDIVRKAISLDETVMIKVLKESKSKTRKAQAQVALAEKALSEAVKAQKEAAARNKAKLSERHAAVEKLQRELLGLELMTRVNEEKKNAKWYSTSQVDDSTALGISKNAYAAIAGKAKLKALEAVIVKNKATRRKSALAASETAAATQKKLDRVKSRIQDDAGQIKAATEASKIASDTETTVVSSVGKEIKKLETKSASEKYKGDLRNAAANAKVEAARGTYRKMKKLFEADKSALSFAKLRKQRKIRDMDRGLHDAKYEVKDATWKYQDAVRNAFRARRKLHKRKLDFKQSDSKLTNTVIWAQKAYLKKLQNQKMDDRGKLTTLKTQLDSTARAEAATTKDVSEAKARKKEADDKLSKKDLSAIMTEEESRKVMAAAVAKAKALAGGTMSSLEAVLKKDAAAAKAAGARFDAASKKKTEQKELVAATQSQIKVTIATNVANKAKAAAQAKKLADMSSAAKNDLKKAKANLAKLKKNRWNAGTASEKRAKTEAKKAVAAAHAAMKMLNQQMEVERKAASAASKTVASSKKVLEETISSTRPQMESANNAMNAVMQEEKGDEKAAKTAAKDEKKYVKKVQTIVQHAKSDVKAAKAHMKTVSADDAQARKDAAKAVNAAKEKAFAEEKAANAAKAAEQSAVLKANSAKQDEAAKVMDAKKAEAKIQKMRAQEKDLQSQIVAISAQKEKLWADAKTKTEKLRKDWSKSAGSDFILQQKIKAQQKETESKASALAEKLSKLKKRHADLGLFFKSIENKNMASAAERSALDVKIQQSAAKAKAAGAKADALVKTAQENLKDRQEDATRLKARLDAANAQAAVAAKTVRQIVKGTSIDMERDKENEKMDRLLAKVKSSMASTKAKMRALRSEQTSRILTVEHTPKPNIKSPTLPASTAKAGLHAKAKKLKAKAAAVVTKLSRQGEKSASGFMDAVVRATTAIDKVQKSKGMISQQVQSVTRPMQPNKD
jgi:hypothetical protein